MYSLPVRCDGNNGIGELKGVLRFDGKQLSLQYQTADPIMHEFRTPPVTLPIDAETIVSARFGAGFLWLRPSITLRLSDIQALAALPTAEAGMLRLRMRWADRRDARRIIESIDAIATQLRLDRLDQSINEMTASLSHRTRAPSPAAQPSVTPPRQSDNE
jgi:signal transduction histidine kinase